MMNTDHVRESLRYLETHFQRGEGMSESTVAGRYFLWLAEEIKKNLNDPLFCGQYLPIIRENSACHGKVFASAVMRTQGRRPQALREALQSLCLQTDRDFEVLLIGHKLTEEGRKVVKTALEELPGDFREQIRFLTLDHGTRTTPINFGFAHAHGKYITVFDDDDLVTPDWLADFKQAAQEHPDTLLHCHTLSQHWRVEEKENGAQTLCANGETDQIYCVDFDMTAEMHGNLCPPIGLAFPAVFFREWGFIFDEKLTTTEDWDYLMRVAAVSGVTDVKKPNALYRIWDNAESSATVHSEDEWRKNYLIIREKLGKMPVVLFSGNDSGKGKMDGRLYYSNSGQYTEEASVEEKCAFGHFEMRYSGLSGKHTQGMLRWDPASQKNLIVRDLYAAAADRDGNTYYFKKSDISSNGLTYHNGLLFLEDDPQMYFKLPKGFDVDKFTVMGESSQSIPIEETGRMLKVFVGIRKLLVKLRIHR